MVFLNKIAQLEAEFKFKDDEISELNEKLAQVKEQKRRQIEELQEQVQEYREKVNQAYKAQVELKFFKERSVEAEGLRTANAELKKELMEVKAEMIQMDV